MIKVKICGITNEKDALKAAEMGATAIGFVFAESPRQVTAARAAMISRELPPFIYRVGVFVNETQIKVKEIIDFVGLDFIQLHGEEDISWHKVFPKQVIKTASKTIPNEWIGKARAFLVDSITAGQRGGTGVKADWMQASAWATKYPIILAGGLNPGNVQEAIRKVRPMMIDVCSGVELTPGKKDYGKLERFFKAVKEED